MKNIFLLILSFFLLANSFHAISKSKKCAVEPAYDIRISKQEVSIIGRNEILTMTSNGSVKLNNNDIYISPNTQMVAKDYQAYLRISLPRIEQQAYAHLTDVKLHFDKAIEKRLGNSSHLLFNLNSLYLKLTDLLHNTIIIDGDLIDFRHHPFNNIKNNGERIARQVFFSVLKDSVKNFSVIKNYSALKQIAREEWKIKKPALKQFELELCEQAIEIHNKYLNLMQLIQSEIKEKP